MHSLRRNVVGMFLALLLLAVIGTTLGTISFQAYAVSNETSFVTAYRRLTESQYRHAIADTFGDDIKIEARFEPELREGGLQAIGNARLSITTSGLEQYLMLARSIADQVVEGENAETLLGCSPQGSVETECAKQFIETKGGQLFRRPLADDELTEFLSTYTEGQTATKSAVKGFKLSLIAMLMSPEFLFRVERAEIQNNNSDSYRLDAYTKAARLSYSLWDAAPDNELMSLARSGEIHKPEVLEKQIDRLLASPRLEDGVRAFFTDVLQFERFESLTKDGATYPKFSQAVADSAREETLKFLVDHMMAKDGDFREIFTSKDTFINRTLAAVYDVPYLSKEPWVRHTFSDDSARSGILTQITFLSLFSHPAASSPTVRGVKLYEIFNCIKLPDPPPDVDFSTVQALEKGTVRERLIEHKTNPGCYACHNVSDPPGLALEHFDGLGQHRTLENGALIDVSAEIDGKAFDGSLGLGDFMRDNLLATSCMVRNTHSYAVGRMPTPSDRTVLTRLENTFAENDYRLKPLWRSVLTDPDFFKVIVPENLAIKTDAMNDNSIASNTGVSP